MAYSPTYITHNRYGVYYFQYRTPLHLRLKNPTIGLQFRKSLKTKNRKEALAKARHWWVVMDRLARQFFDDADSYGKAMALYAKHSELFDLPWHEAEEVLLSLDDHENDLLTKAFEYEKERGVLQETEAYAKVLKLLTENGLGATPEPEPVTTENPTLAEVIDRYIAQREPSWAPSSAVAFRQKCSMFNRIVTEFNGGRNPHVSDIDERMVRHYRDVISKLPPHTAIKPEYKGKSIQVIVKRSDPPMSPKTVKIHASTIADLFKWIENDGYPVRVKAGPILSQIKAPKGNPGGKRVAFDVDDLKKLFQSRQYQDVGFRQAADYWAPLLALFSGGTQSELLQLHVHDVLQVDGIWVMDINDKGDKSLKTPFRNRQVPIHTQLRKLGFLRYVQWLRDKGETKVFPDENRLPTKHFAAFSKRFNRYRKSVGVQSTTDARKDFHSFRHLVAGYLIGRDVQESTVNAIIGHSTATRTESVRTYSEGPNLKTKARVIESLKYDIDFDGVKPFVP